MKTKDLIFEYNGIAYPVVVTYKRVKNTYFRFKDGVFLVSANPLLSDRRIMEGLEKFAPKLTMKRQPKKKPYSLNKGYVYVFGEYKAIDPDIHDDKFVKKMLRSTLLDFLDGEVRKYEKIMGIHKPYTVRVKDMASRHGSNSRKTHSLSFQLSLVHYHKDIIRSVIVHELAHDKVFNHSKKFYDVVYQYCPNYDELKHKLDKGEF